LAINAADAPFPKKMDSAAKGWGRAGLIASDLLMERGISPDETIRCLSAARRVALPETDEQRAWIESIATTSARKP
jgi:hypothetical protein